MPGRDQFTEPITRLVTVNIGGNDIDLLQPLDNVEVTVYKLNEDGTRAGGPAALFATRGPDNAPFAPGNPFVTAAGGGTGFFAPPGEYEIFYHDLDPIPRTGDQSIWWSSMPGKPDGLTDVVLPDRGERQCPPGTVLPFAGSVLPAGWAWADGSVANRLGTHARLFEAIGTDYNTGGEDAAQFRLPDLRGRSFIGADDFGAGAAGRLSSLALADRARGKVGGADAVSLTVAQMPPHNHAITDPGHQHNVDAVGFRGAQRGGGDNAMAIYPVGGDYHGDNWMTAETRTTGISVNSNGGVSGVVQAHPNLPPYQLGMWIIKL